MWGGLGWGVMGGPSAAPTRVCPPVQRGGGGTQLFVSPAASASLCGNGGSSLREGGWGLCQLLQHLTLQTARGVPLKPWETPLARGAPGRGPPCQWGPGPLRTGGVAARAAPGLGIRAPGPDAASPPAVRAGRSARANESCRLAKAVATEQRCRAASCGGDGRATLNPQVLCSPVLPGSIRTARPVTPPTGAGPNCKNIKGIFRWTYCAHALLRNGSVFLLPGTPLRHGANRRKDAVLLRNTRVPPAPSSLGSLRVGIVLNMCEREKSMC